LDAADRLLIEVDVHADEPGELKGGRADRCEAREQAS
jgi:hypothetical protein